MDAQLIGVAISTHRRPDVLARSLQGWARAMPNVLIVNHDVDGDGVAITKNKGIATLMDSGCEHLFLADDDIHPISPNWAQPYIDSDQCHLMHCWGKTRYMYTDNNHTVWTWPRGVLLYVTRDVIDKIGGMRTDFKHAGEHAEWSRRIHAAGFTRHEFQDVATSGLWHAEDYTRSTPSSLPRSRYSPQARKHRQALYRKYRGNTDFVDYR